jgi:hypothetical protein
MAEPGSGRGAIGSLKRDFDAGHLRTFITNPSLVEQGRQCIYRSSFCSISFAEVSLSMTLRPITPLLPGSLGTKQARLLRPSSYHLHSAGFSRNRESTYT